MQEVKRIFHDKYQECEITQRPEYKLGRIEKPTVYSVDCIFNNVARIGGSRCDEFIFFNLNPSSTGIYLVERKDNHSSNVNKVKEQLQGGANFIEDFLKNDPATEHQLYDFTPVWVSRGLRRTALRQLKKHKVTLRSSSKRIIIPPNKTHSVTLKNHLQKNPDKNLTSIQIISYYSIDKTKNS